MKRSPSRSLRIKSDVENEDHEQRQQRQQALRVLNHSDQIRLSPLMYGAAVYRPTPSDTSSCSSLSL
ncbi:hypothetical protein SDJN02_23698, partial [Cucurbita argyrosperma subsp. argyrosperma]